MKKEVKGLYNLVLAVLLGMVMIFTVSCENKESPKNKEISLEEKQEIAEATKPVAELEVQEIAKKQWETVKEFKPEVPAEMVYDKTKKEEYQVKIKAEYTEENGQVDFNKNGLYLTVFETVKDSDIPNVKTYDLLEEYAYYIAGDTKYRDNYEIVGNKAYPIEFGDGSFGIAFLFKDEDSVFPAIVRYGNVVTGIHNNVIVPKLQLVKFMVNGEEYFAPSEYLITRITVQGKDIVITYGDGSKEHWQTTLNDNEEKSYYLKRIS